MSFSVVAVWGGMGRETVAQARVRAARLLPLPLHLHPYPGMGTAGYALLGKEVLG